MFLQACNTKGLKAARTVTVLVALGLLCCSACMKKIQIEDYEEIDINGTDPLSFTCKAQQEAATRSASSPLTTDFMVDTYKAYGSDRQFTVMENYHVEYKTTGSAWDGTVRPYWDYSKVEGQYVKYWDMSSFPYRFNAVAPYPYGGNVKMEAHKLTINAAFYHQTCNNGLVTTRDGLCNATSEKAEPYIVAQVQRDNDGKDKDFLALSPENSNLNNNSTTRNREVWMPFHHLNSKIRFAVYSLHPWVTENLIYITDLSIKVSSDNFITAADKYSAEDDDRDGWRNMVDGNSGFEGLTSSDTHPTLLRFDGGKDVPGNDLRTAQTKSSAFFLQCKEGMIQLPQENVKMTVSFKLRREDGSLYKEFTDVPIRYELDGSEHVVHNWQSGYIYSYYLVLGGIDDKLEISFTCSLEAWEEVYGSLSTDLEK